MSASLDLDSDRFAFAARASIEDAQAMPSIDRLKGVTIKFAQQQATFLIDLHD
jgi:hypothetical protein